MNRDFSKFRRLIIQYREEAKLDDEQIAKDANLEYGFYKKVESGKRNPPSREGVKQLIGALTHYLNLDFHKRNEIFKAAGYHLIEDETLPSGIVLFKPKEGRCC
ncbi:hypothetical protein ACFL0F_00210 [Patescibacteria group bacterium]